MPPRVKHPKQAPKSGTAIAFHVDDELLGLIDSEAERLRVQCPGVNVTRAEACRALLYQASKARAV